MIQSFIDAIDNAIGRSVDAMEEEKVLDEIVGEEGPLRSLV